MIAILFFIILTLDFALLIRATQVHEYRSHLIDKIHKRNIKDIDRGRPWLWRWDEYYTVSFNSMVIQFWRSPKSFFPKRLTR